MSLPIRPCHACGAYDDHPRHVHAGGPSGDQLMHLDCCAAAGCPGGTCPPQIKGANGATGDKLRAHLTKGSK